MRKSNVSIPELAPVRLYVDPAKRRALRAKLISEGSNMSEWFREVVDEKLAK